MKDTKGIKTKQRMWRRRQRERERERKKGIRGGKEEGEGGEEKAK